MPINISKRLLAIANLVPECDRLADIGTDHGYLPVYLLQCGKVKSAIAADIAKGPLERAQNTIKKVGLSESVETRLSDGLEKIEPKEADCIVISGMGGILIRKILSSREDIIKSAGTIVLSPQSDLALVRDYMSGICGIADEDIIEEEGKYYFIIRYDLRLPPKKLDEKSLEYGPVLIEKRHPKLLEYLRWQEEVMLGILEKIKQNTGDSNNSGKPCGGSRISEIENKLRLIREVGI